MMKAIKPVIAAIQVIIMMMTVFLNAVPTSLFAILLTVKGYDSQLHWDQFDFLLAKVSCLPRRHICRKHSTGIISLRQCFSLLNPLLSHPLDTLQVGHH